MFTVDEVTAEAIRRAFDDGGELAGVVELRRHFPLLADNANAWLYVRTIAGWQPMASVQWAPGGAGKSSHSPVAQARRPSTGLVRGRGARVLDQIAVVRSHQVRPGRRGGWAISERG